MAASDSVLSRECERPRTFANVQMTRLRFDTPSNAAYSLRILSSLANLEHVTVDAEFVDGGWKIGVKEKSRG